MHFYNMFNCNKPTKTTVMDTIVKNIKGWRREFSGGHWTEDSINVLGAKLSSTSIKTEKYKSDNRMIEGFNAAKIQAKDLQTANAFSSISYNANINCNNSLELEKRCKKQVVCSPKYYEGRVEQQYSGHSSPTHSQVLPPCNAKSIETLSETPSNSSCYEKMAKAEVVLEEEDYDSGYDRFDEEEDDWQVVKPKKLLNQSNYKGLPLVYCDQKALCSKGGKCKDKHTAKEKETFEAKRIAKLANEKDFSDTKFRTEICKVLGNHNEKKCRFAHGPEQLICKACNEVGHKKDTCITLN